MSEPKSLGDLLTTLASANQLKMLETLVDDSEKSVLQYAKTLRSLESGIMTMERAAKLVYDEKKRAAVIADASTIKAIREVLRKTHARYLEEGAELRAILEAERARFLNEPVER